MKVGCSTILGLLLTLNLGEGQGLKLNTGAASRGSGHDEASAHARPGADLLGDLQYLHTDLQGPSMAKSGEGMELVQTKQQSGGKDQGRSPQYDPVSTKGKVLPFVHVILGILVLLCAVSVSCLNERRQIRLYNLVDRAREKCQTNWQPEKVDDSLDMRLVHCSGEIVVNEFLQDEEFGIEVPECLRLKRTVKMCQWKHNGGSDFTKQWSEEVIDSSAWAAHGPQYANTNEWAYGTNEFTVEQAFVGRYKLTRNQVQRLSEFEQLELFDSFMAKIIKKQAQGKLDGFDKVERVGNTLILRVKRLKAEDETTTTGDDQVGDLSIHWEVVPSNITVTLMAQQMKSQAHRTFRQWNPDKPDVGLDEDNDRSQVHGTFRNASQNYWCQFYCFPCILVEKCFEEDQKEIVDFIQKGQIYKEQVFSILESTNAFIHSLVRFSTWILFAAATFLVLSIDFNLVKSLPLVSKMAKLELGWVDTLITSIIVGTIVHVLKVAMMWVPAQPIYSVGLILVVAFLAGALLAH